MTQENGKEISFGKRFDNAARSFANGVTFGTADLIAGYLNAKTGLSSSKNVAINIEEEIKKTVKSYEETPNMNRWFATVGAIVATKVPKTFPSKESIEHLLAITGLNYLTTEALKEKIVEEKIIINPERGSGISVDCPSVPNLIKELTGQKAPPVTRR